MLENVIDPTESIRKPFNWRLFWLLCGLNIAALLAMMPFSLSQPSLQNPDLPLAQTIPGVAITLLLNALIYSPLIALGLVLASRTGLGTPVFDGWLAKKPVLERIKAVLKPAIKVGLILPIVNLLIIILTRMLEQRPTEIGFFPSSTSIAPRWQLFLSAISAGITEEILFRLFLFTLFAWLGSCVFRSRQRGHKKSVLWFANILSALLFGLSHLATARLDVPMSVMRSIGLNSLGGLAFGWLYGFYGLESAMVAHTVADILFYIVAPYFISF